MGLEPCPDGLLDATASSRCRLDHVHRGPRDKPQPPDCRDTDRDNVVCLHPSVSHWRLYRQIEPSAGICWLPRQCNDTWVLSLISAPRGLSKALAPTLTALSRWRTCRQSLRSRENDQTRYRADAMDAVGVRSHPGPPPTHIAPAAGD